MKKRTKSHCVLAAVLCSAGLQGQVFAEKQRKAPAIPRPMDPLSERARFRPDRSTPPGYRSIDGSENNLTNPDWGAAGQTFLRRYAADIPEDGDSPSGANRPSARLISNEVVAQESPVPNRRGASDFLWQWGQFLDHDITETPTVDPPEAFDIQVPTGDPWFDPQETGEAVIPMNRSFYRMVDDVREQVNAISAFIDASNVYGSDEERNHALRENDGTGRLKVTESEHGDLLPYNDEFFENAPAPIDTFFLAGDVRANEQIALIAMHTLFVREHNYQAARFLKKNAGASGEEAYQHARKIVGAEMQAITYNEFLPVLLGKRAIPRYRGYKSDVDPSIANSFATACYRVGHTLLSPSLMRVDKDGEESSEGHIALSDAFFNPSEISDNGIDAVLRGLAAQRCQELDGMLVDDVRNLLFGAPGSDGFDLASLNLQRGRDHALPSYTQMQEELDFKKAKKFRSITKNRKVARKLRDVYGDVELVDLWIGGLCEDHVPGAMVGRTFHKMLTDQFIRLRDGDRFWYERALPKKLVHYVKKQTLSEIIRRNTDIGDELSENVFIANQGDKEDRYRQPGRPPRRGPRRGR